MNRKRIIKHTIALIVILLLTAVVEILCFNGNAVFDESYSHKYSASGRNGYQFEKSETDEYIIYSMDTQGEYIDKFYMTYQSEDSFSYTVSLLQYESITDGANGTEENNIIKISDKATGNLERAVTHINQRADKVLVRISKEDIDEEVKPSISSFVLSNSIQINPYRVVFIFVSIFIGYVILFMRRTVVEHPEYTFFAIAISMGTMITILSPVIFKSWDEEIHFNRAYSITFSDNVEYTQSTYNMYSMNIPDVNTMEERDLIADYLQEKNYEITMVKEKTSDFVDYSKRAYLPQAFGLKLGRTVGLPFLQTIWLGKFFNLLVYSLIFSLSVKYAKFGKRALLCVGLLPTSLFLASTYSYDAFVTAFLMLGLVMIFNELVDRKSELNWKCITVGVFTMILGSFSKAVYIPLLLLLCFVPKEKFKNRRQRKFFVLTVILIFLIMMSSFVLPALGNVVGNIDTGGDSRGGNTSVTRQIMYILGAPVGYAKLLLETMGNSIGEYFLGYRSRTFFGYMGGNGENLYLLSVVLTIFVTITGENKIRLNRRMKIITGIILTGVAALIWTALYLDFTPVGADVINGVQPRYYIPLMFPVMLLFSSGKIKCEMNELRYNRIVLLTNLVILSGCIYSLILLPFCS